MTEFISRTTERMLPDKFESKEEYLLYLRHLFAYGFAKDNISKNSFVLEVGCGEGYGTRLFSENVVKIIGLDVDKNTIASAQKKYGSENCIFRLYDGLKIPYEDNIFDAVISFQVIEHIQDDKNFISEIYRVLKRNGIFILTTPNGTLRIKPGQRPWNRFHVREYYPNELEQVLKSKFSDVKVWGIRGNEEVQRIEIERVKQSLSIISYDPLNVRKLLPAPLKQRIIKILRGITFRKQGIKHDSDFLNRYSIKDFYILETNVSDSLDLLGILKKSS